MLTERDIMIGDWVMYDPNVFIEDEYEPTKQRYPIRIGCGEDIDLAIEGCYDAISIDTDVLKDNGFKKELDKDGVHFRYILTEGSRSFSILYASGVFQWIYPLDLRYIHELQHALRLCGIKKEIEICLI